MEGKKSDITILIVDNDHATLSMVSTVLRYWEYQVHSAERYSWLRDKIFCPKSYLQLLSRGAVIVVTASSGHEAMASLHKYRSYFNLVITNLHMPIMNGIELLQQIKEKFQLPVIIMSEDKSRNAIMLSLKNGAAYYLFKPLSAENVKDLWRYAKAAEKVKDIKDADSAVPSSGVRITAIEDADANASPSSSASRSKKAKRKRSMATKQGQYREKSIAPKKLRVVWTNELHNQFLMAIRQLGIHRAAPKKIFEIMNVPGLARENVASHLQKYRLFLKKVDELLSLKGGSGNILTSKLAKGLSYGVIQEIQKKIDQIRTSSGSRTRGTLINPTLYLSKTSSILLQASKNFFIPQVLSTQLSNASFQGLNFEKQQEPLANSMSQVRPSGQSLFGRSSANSFLQQILGGNPSFLPYQTSCSYNKVSNLAAYDGRMGSYDSINAANSGLGNVDYSSLANISQGNESFNHGASNGNQLRSFGTSNLHLSSTYYPTTSSNYSGIQGGFAGFDSSSVLSPAFSIKATQKQSFSGLPPSSPQLEDLGNAGPESQSSFTSNSNSQLDQFDKELNQLFFFMDSISLLDEESSNVTNAPTESMANGPNELLSTLPNENPNQLKLQDPVAIFMEGDPAQPNKSAIYNIDQDWDIDLIEALFGTDPPKN